MTGARKQGWEDGGFLAQSPKDRVSLPWAAMWEGVGWAEGQQGFLALRSLVRGWGALLGPVPARVLVEIFTPSFGLKVRFPSSCSAQGRGRRKLTRQRRRSSLFLSISAEERGKGRCKLSLWPWRGGGPACPQGTAGECRAGGI